MADIDRLVQLYAKAIEAAHPQPGATVAPAAMEEAVVVARAMEEAVMAAVDAQSAATRASALQGMAVARLKSIGVREE
jgi:hypothetical protein